MAVDLPVDPPDQLRPHLHRRDQQPAVALFAGIAGDRVEQLADVRCDLGVVGQQADVGVDARRDRVVVASREVHVRVQLARLAAQDETHLGVRLQSHHAVDHVDAGGFQRPGPADVVLLVEASLQLDQDRDLLALGARFHQRLDHGRVGPDAVERLLDRDHVRVGGRLAQQPHHRREAVVRVVQQVVPPADRLEQRFVATQRRMADRPDGRVPQFGPVEEGDLTQIREPQGRRQRVDLEWRQPEVAHEDGADLLGHVLPHLEPHDRTEVPLADNLHDRGQQIVRFIVLDLHVGIARDAERVGRADLEARKQQVEIGRDQLLDPHELAARRIVQAEFVPATARRANQPRQERRHLDAGEALPLVPVVDHHGQVQAQVGDVGEGMAGIEGERRQDREDLALEVSTQLAPLLHGKVVVGNDLDPGVPELRQQIVVPAAIDEFPLGLQVRTDAGQLLGRRHAVRRRLQRAPFELPHQAGDADHEELVQVTAVDRQELDPLKQGMPGIACLFLDPAVELQPTQFTVDVVLGQARFKYGRLDSGLRLRFRFHVGRRWNRRQGRLDQICSG